MLQSVGLQRVRYDLATEQQYSLSPFKFVFYDSVSVSHISLIVSPFFFFGFHIYVILHDICFSLSDLISFSMIISRSIHVVANGHISPFIMTEYYSVVIFHL